MIFPLFFCNDSFLQGWLKVEWRKEEGFCIRLLGFASAYLLCDFDQLYKTSSIKCDIVASQDYGVNESFVTFYFVLYSGVGAMNKRDKGPGFEVLNISVRRAGYK